MSKGLDLLSLMPQAAGEKTNTYDQVYEALANALMQGRIPPLKPVSLRKLAEALNVSPMPVREAVRRLIAEKALELQASNKRLRVPDLGDERLEQLMMARLWVEPELARRAAPNMTKGLISRLKSDDAALMKALQNGDVAGYMQANQDFHFTIYEAAKADLLIDMAKMLWLQAGPFMRVVFGKLGTVHLPKDHHQELISAFDSKNADAAFSAMHDDIHEGMELMVQAQRAAHALKSVKSPKLK